MVAGYGPEAVAALGVVLWLLFAGPGEPPVATEDGAGTPGMEEMSPYDQGYRYLQAGKFDPKGNYIRQFVPELAALPDRYLGAPWEAPADVLASAGITLGKSYPLPIVDHVAARNRALDALQQTRN